MICLAIRKFDIQEHRNVYAANDRNSAMTSGNAHLLP